MSLQARFTTEEIFLLANTPNQIGTVMSFAEGSGLGTVKELMASTKSIAKGVKTYPNNAIINGIQALIGHDPSVATEAKQIQEHGITRLEKRQVISSEMLRDQLIKDASQVAKILATKADAQEAAEYKAWAMSIAENVAKAAKEGGILGIGGTQVSNTEKDMFTQIATALGTTTNLI